MLCHSQSDHRNNKQQIPFDQHGNIVGADGVVYFMPRGSLSSSFSTKLEELKHGAVGVNFIT